VSKIGIHSAEKIVELFRLSAQAVGRDQRQQVDGVCSGPYRSISVALRYWPRRSHLVQARRTISKIGTRDKIIGRCAQIKRRVGPFSLRLSFSTVPRFLTDPA
jgi:hypothetical protein